MVMETLAPPILVQSISQLSQLVDELSLQPRIAVDTESNSLHAYRERVCLIQFSTPQNDYLVDPLALDDLSLLEPIFSNPDIEKIFHAAEYDIICLRRDYGFTFANLFDTMQAGRILGRKQAGLDRLLDEKFSVKVNKRFQKADWGARPLSRDLVLYARLDTHYLIPLRDLLKTELEEKGLWPLAVEDFRMACMPNGSKPKSDEPYWARFSSRRDMSSQDLTVLKELVLLRERLAERLDRPPFKVMDDDKLVAIARAKPSTLEELSETGLTTKQMDYWGKSVLEAVRRGAEGPLVKREPPQRPNEAYLKRLDKLKVWRKKVAEEMDVESDVVLPKSLLLALAERGLDDVNLVMQNSPWRFEKFGSQIQKVLGG
jgi:ribonuclease D